LFAPRLFPFGARVKLKDTGGTWHGVVVVPDNPEDLKEGTKLVEFESAPTEHGYAPGQRIVVPTAWLEHA
jgi:hypothetical protein